MIEVKVRGKWRRAVYIVPHPSGLRYLLLPIKDEPDTVLVEHILKKRAKRLRIAK